MRAQAKSFVRAAEEAVKEDLRTGIWTVYPRYVTGTTDRGEVYMYAPRSEPLEEYRPLVDTPGLFLEFAGLADEGITQEVWLDWVECYGVLGFEQETPLRYAVIRYRELGLGLDDLLAELDDLTEHKWGSVLTEGGPRETYRSFAREAYTANRLLRLYEAATSLDGPDVAVIERYAPEILKEQLATAPHTVKEVTLGFAGYTVHERIAEDCYPALHQEGDKILQGWGFHSLLGAMYLQMAWLMTATGEIRRCEGPGCSKVIRFDPPTEPLEDPGLKRNPRGKYKTRIDKKFCSTNCRVKWHYHNKKIGDRKRT